MKNDNISRIQRVSGKFRLLFTALIFLTPIATLMSWAFFNALPEDGFHNLPVTIDYPLPFKKLLLGALVSLIPLSVVIYGLVNLKTLFSLYEKAIVFSEHNTQCLHRLGYTLIAWFFASLIYTPLISLALTFNSPTVQQAIVVRIGLSDLSLLITGGIVFLTSWVMQEAANLENERALTI